MAKTTVCSSVKSGRDQSVPAFLFFLDPSARRNPDGLRNDMPNPGIGAVARGFGKVRMASIAYKVMRDGDRWTLGRDGKPAGMSYLAQEAAFEAVVGKAGGDLRSGHDIVIQVNAASKSSPGRANRGGEPILGDGFRFLARMPGSLEMPVALTPADVVRQVLLHGAGRVRAGFQPAHMEGRPAGVRRTASLVALAACLAMIQANWLINTIGGQDHSFVRHHGYHADAPGRPDRYIRFIGSGAILKPRQLGFPV